LRKPITVIELTTQIKNSLESEFPAVLVEGEISNFTDHTSGHIYFTLKDDKSQIRCTLWKYYRKILKFMPEDGMKVVISGSVRVYEKGGNYQLNVTSMEPAGIGALQLAFEQLKEKLSSEGIFDEAHKQEIPPFPERIGIVTSETGAALRDIVNIVRRRMPGAALVLNPAMVQGPDAAADIARAVREFNEYRKVDVIIVGRGGGSLEDLWAFNEETVARAIFKSRIPVISAVGHEVDYTIADFTADLRAPTPSAAAELVVKSRDELILQVKASADSIAMSLKNKLEGLREKLSYLARRRALTKPQEIVTPYYQRIDELMHILKMNFGSQYALAKNTLKNLSEKLEILNPLSVLNGKVITHAEQVASGDMVETVVARGSFRSSVLEIQP
jgi:exodeoxyribonuclease VII large subunit